MFVGFCPFHREPGNRNWLVVYVSRARAVELSWAIRLFISLWPINANYARIIPLDPVHLFIEYRRHHPHPHRSIYRPFIIKRSGPLFIIVIICLRRWRMGPKDKDLDVNRIAAVIIIIMMGGLPLIINWVNRAEHQEEDMWGTFTKDFRGHASACCGQGPTMNGTAKI